MLLEDVGIPLDAVGRKSHVPGQRTSQTYPFDLCGDVAEIIVRDIGHLRLTEAAAVLRVSSDTLRAWERRFGYPHSVCGAAGQRRYSRGEVIALRDSLTVGLSIASAINMARGVSADSQRPRRR